VTALDRQRRRCSGELGARLKHKIERGGRLEQDGMLTSGGERRGRPESEVNRAGGASSACGSASVCGCGEVQGGRARGGVAGGWRAGPTSPFMGRAEHASRGRGGAAQSPGLARHGHGTGLRWSLAGLVAGPERTGSGRFAVRA
jgi:hypothetical protein